MEDDFRNYLVGLKAKKPVIVCGDMNVAIRRLTLRIRNPTEEAPVLPMKSAQIYGALNAGFIDTFRFSILIKRVRIHGGHTCLMPVPGMQGGELIILCVGGTKRPSCKCLHT